MCACVKMCHVQPNSISQRGGGNHAEQSKMEGDGDGDGEGGKKAQNNQTNKHEINYLKYYLESN